MAPKRTKRKSPAPDPQGMFAGMTVFLIEHGVQSLRLQVSSLSIPITITSHLLDTIFILFSCGEF